jgi:hypothetical protein
MQSLNGVLAAPQFPDSAPFMVGIRSLSNYLAIDVTKHIGRPESPANIAQDLKFLS